MHQKVIVVIQFVCLSVCVKRISKVAALQRLKEARTWRRW